MKRRDFRRLQKAHNSELKTRVAALRQEMQRLQGKRYQRRRKVVFFVIVLLIIIIILSLMKCSCASTPEPSLLSSGTKTPLARRESKLQRTTLPRPRVTLHPLTGRASELVRGEFAQGPEGVNTWVDEFRLQVTSRGPRLSECFSGAAKPGTFRWTSLVNVKNGTVSDHLFEALGNSLEMTAMQELCVKQVLEAPTYQLAGGNLPTSSTPVRVSLVIEF